MARPNRPTPRAEAGEREAEGPRRSALLQDRSRRTRRALVRAALALWTERGFDRGLEETTVEEIARAAGVTKGTFYFHFAHKEDILLELGWGTAEALYEEAADGVARERPADEVIDALLVRLAQRAEAVPRVAVARTVAEFVRRPRTDDGDARHFALRRGFTVALDLGQDQGFVPADADTAEIAVMIEVLAMDTLLSWARGDHDSLLGVLRRRTAVVMAGATHPSAALRPTAVRRRPAAVRGPAG
ncbi:MAG TPA: helix-turn-helix domain-containing protein [Acidimicrobiales bacterium]|nr:helix-turn-helix domain-containing protein [Acidimicrobiales bacterium]